MATLVKYKTADELEDEDRHEREESSAEEKTEEQTEGVINFLSGFLDGEWETAKTSKQTVELRMMDNLRARRRQYSPQMLAALRQMFGAEYEPVYAPVVETKCSAAESWIKEIFFQKGERPWDMSPTPMPDLPDEIEMAIEAAVANTVAMDMAMGGSGLVNESDVYNESLKILPQARDKVMKVIDVFAKKSADEVGRRIEDMFAEGCWDDALSDGVYDVVTFGTMIMKGPVVERKRTNPRRFDPKTGKWKVFYEESLKEFWYRVNPFDIYPLPGTTDPQNGAFFEVIRLTRKDLSDMLGQPGWDEEAVRKVLKEYRSGGRVDPKNTDTERLMLEGKETSDLYNSQSIECLVYNGSAPGQYLLDWGMTKSQVPDAEREYDIVAWKVGPHILKAIINPDPMGKRPYYRACFRDIPDSFWGVGVPELAESAQKLANAVFRSIAVNVALASGPQIEVDVERLATGEQLRIWPYRIWKATNQQLREGTAVNFYQPTMVTEPLMNVFNLCLKMADEDTGVPRYAHGETTVSGAGETASGLSMLMSQSAKGIKMVVKNIDEGVISKSVEAAYQYLMQYEDIDVVGDLEVIASGSYALMAREQQAIRRTEFLVQTANPFDMQVLGVGGRAELLRQALKSLDIDPDRVIKEQKQIEAMAAGAPAGPTGVPPENAAGMVGAGLLTPDGLTPGAPPPAPAETMGGMPVAGRDNQLFESAAGMTP